MTEQQELKKEQLLNPLEGAIDYLEMINQKKGLISDPLSTEDYQTAFKELNNFIDGINELNQLLYTISELLDINYENLKYQEENLNYYITHFNSFLTEDLIPAMENQDFMLLSDLINYELESYLADYKKVFLKLIKYIKELDLGVVNNV